MTSPQVAGEKSVASPAATRYRIVIAVILFITLMVSYLDRTNVSILSDEPGSSDSTTAASCPLSAASSRA